MLTSADSRKRNTDVNRSGPSQVIPNALGECHTTQAEVIVTRHMRQDERGRLYVPGGVQRCRQH